MFVSDYVMICSTAITSVKDTPKKIYPSVTIFNVFYSTYDDDKNNSFGTLFKKYTDSAVKNIYHPAIVVEWKDNMDKAAY